MLTITNIDDCNFSIQGSLGTVTGLKVLGKREFAALATEPVYNETYGRVKVYNINNNLTLVDRTPINEITLNGTVHTTAQAFVVAFNAMMATCVSSDSGGSGGAYSVDYNDWQVGDTESATKTFDADTIHSVTIIVESGTVNVSNGTEETDLITGQSISVTATTLIANDVVIDATNGKAIWVVSSQTAEPTTTAAPTTTEEPTTTV